MKVPPLLLLFHLLWVSAITLLILWFFKILSNSRHLSTKTPPGSTGLPFIGETLAFLAANRSNKGFYDFVHRRHLQYGSCFKTHIFGETHVFISSLDAARAILGGGMGFSKRYMKSIGELLGEESLLCASHEHHRLLRHRIANIFTADCVASVVRHFDELTIRTLGAWKERETVVVFDDALKITFRAICKMLISLEEEDELEILQNDVYKVSEAMMAYPLKFPGARFNEGLKARRRIMNALKKKIHLRRTGLECFEDFLQSLLMSDDSLTESQILDNILTLILAGQITTASAITWMVKYLDDNQEVQERVRVFQLEIASRIPQSYLGLEVMNEISYSSKIVKETLRMATIVSWFPRVALNACEVEGFEIQKGWIVNVDARSIHFDPTIYNDPIKFNPSRFDEDPKPYSFLAFGTGGRTCLGLNLAKAMMMIFQYRLVTTYKWKVTDPDSSMEKCALFPRLRSGCPVCVTPLEFTCV